MTSIVAVDDAAAAQAGDQPEADADDELDDEGHERRAAR